MKVLVVGSGGREHALAWKLAQSPEVEGLWCAPGNPGTAALGTNVPLRPDDTEGLLALARREGIDLTVVGPEEPLVKGIGDAFTREGLLLFGPSAAAARIEGSKVFAKEFMRRAGVPTAEFAVFSDPGAARRYIECRRGSVVVKADGLAGGKGAFVCDTPGEAHRAVSDLLERHVLGAAGEKIVVEERLQGPELSILAVCDGQDYLLLPPARDHKRVFDDDRGPNTGGMGAFAPVPLPAGWLQETAERVIAPVLAGMAREGYPYRGVLYAGLILTDRGPRVLEYNCRFGDPETQAVLPLLEEDLALLLYHAARGQLADAPSGRPGRLARASGAAVCVVLASGGYPGTYRRGLPIAGIAEAEELEGVTVFHAGTARDESGNLVTAGGRVVGVTAHLPTLKEAVTAAYAACARISFPGMHYRSDIAARVRT